MSLRRAFLVVALAAAGCGSLPAPSPTPTDTAAATLPDPTATITRTPSATPSPTPANTPTPIWTPQGPGQVQVPIFLYHHIAVSPIGSRYYVPPTMFDAQLKLLRDWGYQSISTSLLVKAITHGALLPPHPIIFTFDDANEDNYSAAFPIMQKYGFTGVLYVPFDYLGTPNYLTLDQVKTMAAVGWEVGSHTLTHPGDFNLLDSASLRAEVVDSRTKLSDALGVPILTFAYPFGDTDSAAVDYVHFAGYIAAMGATGFTADQGLGNLFVLQRCEIKGSDDVKSMTRFLPWLGDPSFLPTDTPTVTPLPTRTPLPTYTQYPTKTPSPTPTP